MLVRYEDLRSDTLATMRRIYSSLRVPVGERELSEAVEKHAGRTCRRKRKDPASSTARAHPGAGEDLSPQHIEMVERITSSLLEEFYPDER